MKHIITVTLGHAEVVEALRKVAMEKLDIGKPYNLESANVKVSTGELGVIRAVVMLEVE